MNKLILADAILFTMGTVFGLCLGYCWSVMYKYVKFNKKEDLRIIKGGRDESW